MLNPGRLSRWVVLPAFAGLLEAQTFIVDSALPPAQSLSAVAWGETAQLQGMTRLSLNQGKWHFMEAPTALPPLRRPILAWGDYDGDGELDFLNSGTQVNPLPPNPRVTTLYRNNAAISNAPPASPANLQAMVSGNRALLSCVSSGARDDPGTDSGRIGDARTRLSGLSSLFAASEPHFPSAVWEKAWSPRFVKVGAIRSSFGSPGSKPPLLPSRTLLPDTKSFPVLDGSK